MEKSLITHMLGIYVPEYDFLEDAGLEMAEVI